MPTSGQRKQLQREREREVEAVQSMFLVCLMSQQQRKGATGTGQYGQLYELSFELKDAEQTDYFTQTQYCDTDPTSLSTDSMSRQQLAESPP